MSLVGMMLSFGERVSILVDQLFTATGGISHGECSKGVIAGVSDGEVLSLELGVFPKSWSEWFEADTELQLFRTKINK